MQPTGVFHETHNAAARFIHTWPQRAWFIAFLAALVAMPAAVGPYILGVMTVMFITLMAVYGLQVTTGMAGQVNVAQSAFVGVGAFAAAKLSLSGVPFWLVIPLAGIVASLVSVVFALPATRVKGFYLALTTLAAQVMFPIVVIGLPTEWLGGTNGISVEPIEIGDYMLGKPIDMYYLTLVGALIASVFAFNLQRTRMGRAFRAIRDNDIAAEVMGVNVKLYKVLAFVAGSFLAGMAGALFAYYLRYVTTEQFTLFQSIWYLGMLIVGGLGSPLGAILGTAFITILQESLHAAGGMLLNMDLNLGGGFIFAATNVMLGAVIILALILEPRGLVRRWYVMKSIYRLWPFPHT